ncbi:putative leucine-rich repeat receptor-like serine/threonine-protein kinase At2g19230 [Aristolochia californica]|uniref:putative leucine-rich repeat receptor-like serine/threonine-protein kinase At2g19230 n=1 Tax=Aristolochia californica TaxID=171875 RepID=UPI0035DE01E5
MAMAEHLFFLFAIFAAVALAQPGFISIDCGIPVGSNYTDSETGIFYTSDAGFVQSGENREFPSSNLVASSLKRQYRSMRSFPDGERNCYTVRPIQKRSKYFVRASFMYVDYDKQKAPEFDLYVGINLWTRVSLANASLPFWTEIVLVATMNFIPVCLVSTGSGEPFISAVEARLLKDSMYEAATHNQSLLAEWLYDAASTSEQIIRYPDDDYDRFWLPYTDPSWASINTSLTVENSYLGFEPPSAVMRTAATPMNANGSLYFNWTANDPNTEFHIFRHFADFQKSNGSTTLREFYCCNNGDSCFALEPDYLVASTIYTTSPMTGVRDYSISFSKTEKSILPPILNAFEIYAVLTLNETATDEKDVYAIMSIKDIYGLEKNWMADPCLPNKYMWDGLTCSYDDDNPPRIISLNLSSSGLSGKIDASIGNLKLIQSLDLSKNNIEGPIPPFLATLTSLAHLDLSQNNLMGTVPQFLAASIYLSYLNLSHNQLSGSVPISLVDKSRTGSLTLSVDPNLCNPPSCNATDPCALKSCKKSPSVVVPVVVVVAIATVAIGIAVLIWFKCRRPRAARPNPQNIQREGSFNLETRRLSYDEMVTVTNNFQRVIGKGAFGTVYHGQMKDGTEVAVKMLSQHAHASIEFQTEAQLLMTLHHRHLVRFIGYCADGDKKALILEYMAKGNLGELLAAQDEMETLSWDQRLRIGLAVSQGLEYLHVGCKPPIIHRDVKAANILLNENLEAKLADFGICKIFTDEIYAHISTQVKGTHGYLDPEYLSSSNLNEKSDVYSFGVVLLELITGRPAIIQTMDSQKIGLVKWVSSLISGGDVRNIMDPKLQADYDITSAWKALDISISCTQPKSVQRPSISSVVAELKNCLEVERCTDRSSDSTACIVNPFEVIVSPKPGQRLVQS